LPGETEEKHAYIVGDKAELRTMDVLHTRLELDPSIIYVGWKKGIISTQNLKF
jgi:hypothetical protein